MIKCMSIAKIGESGFNEDAAIARSNLISVSDGAGGGGLFAEKWSSYLVQNLPDVPIQTFEALDSWIDQIWESFYNQCEMEAQNLGGLALDKFYDEGSFATLAAAWYVGEGQCQWMSYGDSVVFSYNSKEKVLHTSVGHLADFDLPPYLLNCKDELKSAGFKSGIFSLEPDSLVFVASDALAHYILMMYEVMNQQIYAEELTVAESNHTKNENYIKVAKCLRKIDFEKDVINKLITCVNNSANFTRHLASLQHKGLIAHDDYSIAIFKIEKGVL